MLARSLLLVISLVATGARASAPAPSAFTVRYNATPVHAELRESLERDRVLEQVADALNRLVRLPHGVQIRTLDCGMANAFFDARTQRVTLCYELIDSVRALLQATIESPAELDKAVLGVALFTLYHEIGHGLIQLLDLPAVGREEDAADQLATLALLAMGDAGAAMARDGARWFQLQAEQPRRVTHPWDEHALDDQRHYNVLCLIYGSSPDKHADLVTRDLLPRGRAPQCTGEYSRIRRAWQRLLGPSALAL